MRCTCTCIYCLQYLPPVTGLLRDNATCKYDYKYDMNIIVNVNVKAVFISENIFICDNDNAN